MSNTNELTKELLNVLSTYYDIEDIEITEQEDGKVAVFENGSLLMMCDFTNDGVWDIDLEEELDDDLLDDLNLLDCVGEVF